MNKLENTPKQIADTKAIEIELTATCQLYQRKKEGSDEFIANGCAILFEYNFNYYCFSNAHVLSDSQLGKTFFLGDDGTAVTVGGQIFYTRLPKSQRRADDPLDIAIVKLLLKVADFLRENGQRFLTSSQVQTGVSLLKNQILMIAGYPASKTKVDLITNRLKFNPLLVRTIPFLKDLRNINFPKEFHHTVQFPIRAFKESKTGERWQAAKPAGISGSGLWLLKGVSDTVYHPILVGIISEYHKNRSIIISTKVDLYIDLLKQKFDSSIQNDGVQIELL